jgi:EAL domain-containing protein (putative c-di-GMP-specific phosphodiesterase class I)
VRAEQLEVEVTETVFIDDPAQAREEMERLRALGIKLALDDFGTGYASLAYLRDFRFDRLKLDQGFVRSIAVDDHLRAISGAVVQLAGALGCEVVAEGVEDDDQARILAALGCAVGQGFGLARPGVPEFYFGR